MIGAERFIPVISHAKDIVMRLVILGIAPDHVEYSGGFGQNREKTDTGLGFAFGNFERAVLRIVLPPLHQAQLIPAQTGQ